MSGTMLHLETGVRKFSNQDKMFSQPSKFSFTKPLYRSCMRVDKDTVNFISAIYGIDAGKIDFIGAFVIFKPESVWRQLSRVTGI